MYKNKKVTAVVPTRKGSQRVKSKNTRPFADTTLLELKLDTLKHVKGIDNIIVNTDCERSIEIANSFGIEVHRRKNEFASSNITNNAHWKHIAEVTDTDILLLAQTTSPMIKVKTYEQALDKYLNLESPFDSLNSVGIEKNFMWLDNKPINYDINNTPRSQDLPDIVSLNFAITIIEKELMESRENVIGYNPKFIELDKIEAVDIDDQIDFEFAEFLYKKFGFDWIINK